MGDQSERQPRSEDPAGQNISRKPFGMTLAKKLASALKKAAGSRHPEKRALVNNHRDYCGHGLAYIREQFLLLEIHDGVWELLDLEKGKPSSKPAIASWESVDSFCHFWSRQSDYSCSGSDPDAELFYSTDPWIVGNQRITRYAILRFIKQHEDANKPGCNGQGE